MTKTNYKLTKAACYASNFTMASIFSLPPILFVTFREMYGISYTLLGTLVLVNFCTQLSIDLIFTFFSKHFNLHKTVKIMPLITSAGLLIYALIPTLFPNSAYTGLLIGTIVFSVSAGLSEVLLSPIIAAMPSDNPQRDMSALHSLYAFGLLATILISAVFLRIFGNENWMYLTVLLALLPACTAVMFMRSAMPDMNTDESGGGFESTKKRAFLLALCVACIFFGGCAETAMSNWISSYMEKALHINKTVGDILGMAMFALLLGAARIAYAKFGKNIMKILFPGMAGAFVCYLIAGLSTNVFLSFAACILTGLCTAMLWPGSLIMMEEKITCAGVTAYALMASGGDLGASVAPQLMGIVIDKVSASSFAVDLGEKIGLSAEQIGLKAGMLVTSIFPLLGCIVLIAIIRYSKKSEK